MLKLLKFGGILLAAWLLFFTVVTGWVGASVLTPSLQKNDISLFKVLKGDASEAEIKAIQDSINNKALEMGKSSGKNFGSALRKLFVTSNANDVNTEATNSTTYPFPSSDKVMIDLNKSVEEAQSDGLDYLINMQAEVNKAKAEGLENLEKLDTSKYNTNQ
jgi:hypothetical protein